MASTSANRAIFISSAISWLNKYSLQGKDIDWGAWGYI
jgi:GH18 family chitinase